MPQRSAGAVGGRTSLIDLSEYEFVTLRQGAEFVLRRGHATAGRHLLTVTPALSHPDGRTAGQLEREYLLVAKLDSTWAVRPIALERINGRETLVLEDPGGDPLARSWTGGLHMGTSAPFRSPNTTSRIAC